jgi:hypothetical protein
METTTIVALVIFIITSLVIWYDIYFAFFRGSNEFDEFVLPLMQSNGVSGFLTALIFWCLSGLYLLAMFDKFMNSFG